MTIEENDKALLIIRLILTQSYIVLEFKLKGDYMKSVCESLIVGSHNLSNDLLLRLALLYAVLTESSYRIPVNCAYIIHN